MTTAAAFPTQVWAAEHSPHPPESSAPSAPPSWKKEWADSVVRWELKAKGDSTGVRLTHSKFPNKEERDGHDEGWDMYWLGPMKAWLEGKS